MSLDTFEAAPLKMKPCTLEGICEATLQRANTRENEVARLRAVSSAVKAMRELEQLGFKVGLFGSAQRPGDFFGGSDIDLAAYIPRSSTDDTPITLSVNHQREAKLLCGEILQEVPFDLVFLPSEMNPAFSNRIKDKWMVDAAFIESRWGKTDNFLRNAFTFEDILFIDQDRIQLALNASERLWGHTQSYEKGEMTDIMLLSAARSVSEAICRIADKCAKDVLRHFLSLASSPDQKPALLPLLRLPADINQGEPIISASLENAYWTLRQSSAALNEGNWLGQPLLEEAKHIAELGFLFSSLLQHEVVGFAKKAHENHAYLEQKPCDEQTLLARTNLKFMSGFERDISIISSWEVYLPPKIDVSFLDIPPAPVKASIHL